VAPCGAAQDGRKDARVAGPSPRGAHPDDPRLFGPGALARLRVAHEELTWLLGRGYPLQTALTVVGNHHQLAARQRQALARVSGSDAQIRSRRERRLEEASLAGADLQIDGFNLVITLEVALGGTEQAASAAGAAEGGAEGAEGSAGSGADEGGARTPGRPESPGGGGRGPLLRGADGALRDLAGLRGRYAPLAATDAALALVAEALCRAGVRRARWLLDEAVSSSGRLRARILERLGGGSFGVEAELVRDPDVLLVGAPCVVSSDGVVLDRCASWVNLAADIVARGVPDAWVIDLG